MTTLLLWWLALFGVWPLANPGHDDLTSPLVLFDLLLHFAAGVALLDREIERRARERADRDFVEMAGDWLAADDEGEG